jgi:hypothetical protein
VRVSGLDGSPSDTGDAAFSIIRRPTVVITFPNGGETFAAGSRQVIAWTRAEADTAGAVTIDYTIDNGVSWNVIVSSYAGGES